MKTHTPVIVFLALFAVFPVVSKARAQDLYVGSNTPSNTLDLTNGVSSYSNTYIGFTNAATNNLLTVRNAGTLLTNSNNLYVGNNSSGNQLVVSNGGTVAGGGYGYIGYFSSASNNMATVTGANSLWTNSGSLSVGSIGSGNQLVVSNGGTAAGGGGYIGINSSASNNMATVTGANSLWSNSGSLFVGYSGSGNQLVVSNGGTVRNYNGYIGINSSASNNMATVTGANSLWTNIGDLTVGYSGSGNQLVVSNGGTVRNSYGYIGNSSSASNNMATVTGANSLWSNSSTLTVGRQGTNNTLTVSDGGTVAASGLVLADSNTSSGTLNIGRFGTNDAGGTIIAPTIAFGAGAGRINLNQSNAVTITSVISGNGTINQLGAGTSTLSGLNTYGGVTTVGGGVLRVTNLANAGTSSAIGTNATIVLSNGGVLDYAGTTNTSMNRGINLAGGNGGIGVSNSAAALTISGVMSNTGGLTKSGTGTMILTASNTYTGATTISAGTLALSSGGALSASTAINLSASGARFDISGLTASGSTNGSLAGEAGTFVNLGSKNLNVGGDDSSTTFAGVMSNTGSVTKSGAGTMTLSGANSFSGGINLAVGTLQISNGSSLGSGRLKLGEVGDRATLLVGATTEITNTFLVSDTATNAVVDVVSGSTAAISGQLTQDGTKQIWAQFGKAGEGTLVLNNGTSDYNGQIHIGQGTVVLGATGAMGTNHGTIQRSIDLGLDIADVAQAANVAVLASNGVTVGQSIYVAPNAGGSTRTVGLAGGGATTFSNEIYLDGTMTVDAGTSATDRVILSGNLVHTGGLTKTGAGTVSLSGANTYSGATTVNAGTLALEANNVLSDATAVTVNGGALNLGSFSETVGSLTMAGGALNGAGTLSAATYALQGGTVNAALGAGAVTVSTGTTALGSAGRLNAVSTLTIDSGQLTLGGAETVASLAGAGGTLAMGAHSFTTGGDNTSTAFGGGVTGSGAFIKTGSGTITMSGDSSAYSGTVNLQGGGIIAAHSNAIGTSGMVLSNGSLKLAAGTTLANNFTIGVSGGFTTNAFSTANIATWDFSTNAGGLGNFGPSPMAPSASASGVGIVGLTRGAGLATNGSGAASAWGASGWGVNADASSAIAGNEFAYFSVTVSNGYALNLTNFGAYNVRRSATGPTTGLWQWSTNGSVFNDIGTSIAWGGSNSAGNAQAAIPFTGISALQGLSAGTTVTFRVANWNAASDGGTWYLNQRTGDDFTVNGQLATVTSSAASGTGTLGIAEAGAATYGGNITVNSAATLAAASGGKVTFAGAISGGGSISKEGAGIVELRGENTYTGGTTVNGGTMVVDGSANGSTFTVNTGGTLGGSGSVGGIVLNLGGTVSPGNSPGTLNVLSNAVWNPGGNYNWQVFNASGIKGNTNGYDWMNVSGSLDLTALSVGSEFNINLWSLSGISPDTNGSALFFTNTSNYTWTILTASNGITGFSADKFLINIGIFNGTGGFANALGGGTFSLLQDGNDLNLRFTAAGGEVVPEPGTWAAAALLAGGAAFVRWRRRKETFSRP